MQKLVPRPPAIPLKTAKNPCDRYRARNSLVLLEDAVKMATCLKSSPVAQAGGIGVTTRQMLSKPTATVLKNLARGVQCMPFALGKLFANGIVALAVAISTPQARSDDTPLRITKAQPVPDGGVEFRCTGPAGAVLSLQVSRDLIGWRTIDFQQTTSNEWSFAGPASDHGAARFYRLRSDAAAVTVTLTNYHGWPDSFVLSNGAVEALVVPTVGRIMQFRFAGEDHGPFWENPTTLGQLPGENSWDVSGSFGGDKAWPSPQSAWNWPPPRGFDSAVFTGSVTNGQVTLTGPVDPVFGIRVVRRLELHPAEPLLRVTTTFEKLGGGVSRVGVWVITQLENPVRLFLPVPPASIYSSGYQALGSVPPDIAVTNGLISMTRDKTSSAKIGNDAGALLWIGERNALLIESPRAEGLPRGAYPDNGCSAEIYTNPDPTPYVELELLGPLTRLTEGESISATSSYRLYRRTGGTPLDEAVKILNGEQLLRRPWDSLRIPESAVGTDARRERGRTPAAASDQASNAADAPAPPPRFVGYPAVSSVFTGFPRPSLEASFLSTGDRSRTSGREKDRQTGEAPVPWISRTTSASPRSSPVETRASRAIPR